MWHKSPLKLTQSLSQWLSTFFWMTITMPICGGKPVAQWVLFYVLVLLIYCLRFWIFHEVKKNQKNKQTDLTQNQLGNLPCKNTHYIFLFNRFWLNCMCVTYIIITPTDLVPTSLALFLLNLLRVTDLYIIYMVKYRKRHNHNINNNISKAYLDTSVSS